MHIGIRPYVYIHTYTVTVDITSCIKWNVLNWIARP